MIIVETENLILCLLNIRLNLTTQFLTHLSLFGVNENARKTVDNSAVREFKYLTIPLISIL